MGSLLGAAPPVGRRAGSPRCPGAADSRLAPPGPWEGLSARSGHGALVLSQTRPWFILEEGTYDEYENDLGITAIALYDYQAGEKPLAGQKEGWRGCGTEGFQRLLSRELGLSECCLQFLRRIYI